jgi:hypothetical protein
VVIGAGLYLSAEEPENPRPWPGSALNRGSGPGYGASSCLRRRLVSSIPRSKAEEEPPNSESTRCAAAGKGTGVDCRRASLLTSQFQFQSSVPPQESQWRVRYFRSRDSGDTRVGQQRERERERSYEVAISLSTNFHRGTGEPGGLSDLRT